MEIDLGEYRKQFYLEARDILERANSGVLKAESDINNDELLNSIFREVHTIKGSAGSFELWKVSEFTHHLESLLASLRDKKLKLNAEIVDVILSSLDYIENLLQLSEQEVDFEIDNVKVEQIKQFQVSSEPVKKKIIEEKSEKKKDINQIPSSIAEKLLSSLQPGLKAYFIEILYTDNEFQNGYDPFVLLKNIKKNTVIYIAQTDKTPIPSFHEYDSNRLYLRPTVYCTSELSAEEITDLTFDTSLLRVYEITIEKEVLIEEEPSSSDLSGIDPDMLNEFLVSVEDIHSSIEESLLLYEKDFSEASLNRLFRYIHTIKGDSDYIGLKETVRLTHDLETFLDKLRKGIEKPNQENIDKIFSAVDEIYSNLIQLNKKLKRETGIASISRDKQKIQDIDKDSGFINQSDSVKDVFLDQLKQIHEMLPVQMESFITSPIAKKNITRMINTLSKASLNVGLKSLPELCNVALRKLPYTQTINELDNTLHDILSFIDGFITGKPKKLGQILIDEDIISNVDLQEALKQQKPIGEILVESGKASKEDIDKALRKQEISTLGKQLKSSGTEAQPESSTMKIDESKVDVFYNLIGEMIVARNTYDFCLTQINAATNGGIENETKALKENLHVISRITNEMQRGVMALRMVPVNNVFQKFNRVVRDIARKQKKEIELTISGENVEIDKRVADTLSDPLVHLIRNACDHGIESADERIASGKSAIGNITLKASYEGNHAVIRISDDGKGLNKEKIAAKAKTMGYDTDKMSEEEIYNLIFLPGLSTAEKLTDVSGRGVGMDVVQTTAKSLGGFTKIRSKSGVGTETIISIPISMGVSKSLIIESGGSEFALPLESVIEAIKIPAREIHLLQDRLIFNFRGDVLTLEHLDKLLNRRNTNYTDDYNFYYDLQITNKEISIVVLRTSESGRFAVIVDKLKKNMEIAIKPVPKQLSHIKVISGVTIMGDGGIVQVLNVEGLR
jgi:two-component system chemotaxis sensor kinase CheA